MVSSSLIVLADDTVNIDPVTEGAADDDAPDGEMPYENMPEKSEPAITPDTEEPVTAEEPLMDQATDRSAD